MQDCEIILVTSCKGGVGKTTVCANLAIHLAKAGKRTLMCDLDFGMRCLDIISGLEDSVLYDVCDVVFGACDVKKAVIADPRSENLFFLAAPCRPKEKLTSDRFSETVNELIRTFELEYFIIDTHGGISDELSAAASICDTALIVSTHNAASIRAAEQTNMILCDYGISNARLIINSFDYESVRDGKLPGVIDMIDQTGVRLQGIIPYSPDTAVAQSKGLYSTQYDSGNFGTAFNNIARRIMGDSVPLLQNFKHIKRGVVRK